MRCQQQQQRQQLQEGNFLRQQTHRMISVTTTPIIITSRGPSTAISTIAHIGNSLAVTIKLEKISLQCTRMNYEYTIHVLVHVVCSLH